MMEYVNLDKSARADWTSFQALEAIGQSLSEAIRPIKEFVGKLSDLVQMFNLRVNGKPFYAISPKSTYVELSLDSYGNFFIDGRLSKHYTLASKCGKLLSKLLMRRGNLVTYKELEPIIGTTKGAREMVFRDLKSQLRHDGYKLVYRLLRAEGIGLVGIKKL